MKNEKQEPVESIERMKNKNVYSSIERQKVWIFHHLRFFSYIRAGN